MTTERLAEACAFVDKLVGDEPGLWDATGTIPSTVFDELGGRGLLCPQVPEAFGGAGYTSQETGEFTAHVGSLCSSLRSVITSQGMAAWAIQRLGDARQRRSYLPQLAGGQVAAVGFSEPDAGSDLSGISTWIERDDESIVITGQKVWVTAAAYADLIVVIGRLGDDAAAVVVPASSPGVSVERIADPLGCRAGGHANVSLECRLPAAAMLGDGGQSLQLLTTTALTYGRISVAWGCVGILRTCLKAAVAHARRREQFGKTLGEHQLVERHLAELLVAERSATFACEHASRSWDAKSVDVALATVLAKHVSANHAAQGARSALQVLASAAADNVHPVARAYRDAKLMELIEGSNEICQLILARHALTTGEGRI